VRLDFCVACGAQDNLHQHHVIPRSAGGPDDEWNLITLCSDCHFTLHERRSNGGYNHAQLTADGIAAAAAAKAHRIRTVRVQMVAIFVCVIVAGALAVAFWDVFRHSPVMPLMLLVGGLWLYFYIVVQFARRFPLTAIAITALLQGLFGGRRRRW
jgi:HNH endonuclease